MGEFLREFRAAAPLRMRIAFRGGLLAAVWIAPVCILRLPPIVLYGRETRERALEAMARSRLYVLRQLFGVVKLTVSLFVGRDDRIRDAIDYPLHHDDARRATYGH